MADETDNPTRAPDGRFLKGHSKPGPGRKTRAERHDYTPAVIEAERSIHDKLPVLIENMFILACGVTVKETDSKTGKERVYTKPPDYRANEYLINRVMGKPKESVEVDTPPDSPLIAIFNASLGRIYGDKSDTGD